MDGNGKRVDVELRRVGVVGSQDGSCVVGKQDTAAGVSSQGNDKVAYKQRHPG